jgi:hypothetical protein
MTDAGLAGLPAVGEVGPVVVAPARGRAVEPVVELWWLEVDDTLPGCRRPTPQPAATSAIVTRVMGANTCRAQAIC